MEKTNPNQDICSFATGGQRASRPKPDATRAAGETRPPPATRSKGRRRGLAGLMIAAGASTARAATTDDDAALSSGMQVAGQTVEAILGPWVRGEILPGITWVQLILAAAVLLGVAVAIQTLRWMMRKLARKPPPAAEPGAEPTEVRLPWLKLTLEALIPPVTLFVWAWGAYAVFSVLLAQQAKEVAFLPGLLRWVRDAGEMIALFWFLFRFIRVAEAELRRWTSATDSKWDDVLVAVVAKALRLILPLVGVILVLPTLELSAAAEGFLKQGSSLVLIGAVGFVLYQLVHAVEEAVLKQYRIDVKDNLAARKIFTQVKVLKKIAAVVIVIFSAASMLMVFDSVRQLGTSILASAGVLGIIVGFAAQKSIATVLAGFQIAMTQPIRLDDVVIVENEWGRINEITLTYVVVLIWDQRRLVVPINYFIEQPFQNWTRVSAELLGTIFLHTDYTVPIEALRGELDRILADNELWDGRVKGIQVTDSKERTLEVRVLVSAADASAAWNLRCLVREKLIAFLQRTHPECLPRIRAEVDGAGSPGEPAST